MISKYFRIKSIALGVALTLACSIPAAALDVNGFKFEDTTKVAGKELKLNGAGMRIKVVVKIYAAGLYVPEKKTSASDILKETGPRRVVLQMARAITSEEFGRAFMDGLNDNIDKADRQLIIEQIGALTALFTSVDGLKTGDVLHIDWIPGVGTQCELNGKKLGAPIPGLKFYNALLRIWLGENPVDKFLKASLLGENT